MVNLKHNNTNNATKEFRNKYITLEKQQPKGTFGMHQYCKLKILKIDFLKICRRMCKGLKLLLTHKNKNKIKNKGCLAFVCSS